MSRLSVITCAIAVMLAFLLPAIVSSVFPSVRRQYQQLPLTQRSVIVEAHHSLRLLATRSRTADTLLSFYEKNALVCRLHGTKLVSPGRRLSSKKFWLYVDVTPIRVAPDIVLPGTYHPKENVVVLRDSALSSMFMGLTLAHELQLAHDRKFYGRLPPVRPSSIWLRRELDAHLTVSKILEEYTNGQWYDAVKASLQERIFLMMRAGRPLTSYDLTPGDTLRFRRVLGPMNDHDWMWLKSQLMHEAIARVEFGRILPRRKPSTRNVS